MEIFDTYCDPYPGPGKVVLAGGGGVVLWVADVSSFPKADKCISSFKGLVGLVCRSTRIA